MKQLSIEEKAKAYDEALKQIKECVPDDNGFITIYPQEIFPELAELEDERIRKELIRVFSNREKYVINQSFGDINVSDILAWLEKQKDNHKDNHKDIEQKSADKSDSVLNILNKENREVQQEDLIKKPSLKACNEESERILNEVISVLDNGFLPSSWERARLANGLQSLKDRVQPQPKQEWGEEDEKLTNRIEGWLDTLCDYLKDSSPECIEDVKDIVEQLKSLKDRYTWKPSDEQMKALAYALSLAKYCGGETAFDLRTLYEQLKKLREE